MRIMLLILCAILLPIPVSALEIEAPQVPQAYLERMPSDTVNLSAGLQELIREAINGLRPDLQEAVHISVGVLSAVLLVSILETVSSSGNHTAEMTGTVFVAVLLLSSTDAMIRLAAATVEDISDYGKLLLPVMTTALAAQGGLTSSGVLYAGTAFFSTILQAALNSVLVPGVFLYIVLCVGSAVTGEQILKRMGDLLKQFLGWTLKMLVIIFTTYLSLTHVISGTTDVAALKAAKVSMSSFIPVVGGILSDASEAVLVSAGLMKNAAGVYGILAVLAVFLHPFLQIGLHYLILKLTGGVGSVFGTSRMTAVIDAFGSAMALLLAMTAASCIIVLISTVCFMKGVG